MSNTPTSTSVSTDSEPTGLRLWLGLLAFLALIVALLLWIAVAAMVVTFWRVRPLAGVLMLPYSVWGAFAISLNFAIWRMNT